MNTHVTLFLAAMKNMKETDITIKTKDGELQANSFILKARSPVFQAMLTWQMRENKTKVIDMSTYQRASVCLFIKYLKDIEMPSDNVSIPILVELHDLADQYDQPELKKDLVVSLIAQASILPKAFKILRHCMVELVRNAALKTIFNQIGTPGTDKIKLSDIEDDIKILIFDYVMEKKGLVAK